MCGLTIWMIDMSHKGVVMMMINRLIVRERLVNLVGRNTETRKSRGKTELAA